MYDYTNEIRAYIEAQKEELRLPKEVHVVFDDIQAYYHTSHRSQALETVLFVLEQEALLIDASYTAKLHNIQDQLTQYRQKMNEHIDWLLTELTAKKWFSLIQLLENNQQKEQTRMFIDLFTAEQKQTFYQLIRTIEHTKEETILLRQFEERLTYTYAFLRRAQATPSDETLRPFEQFFETYVPVYHQKTAATLRWLKKDVFTMELTDALLERYAQSAVRRLEIGEDLEDPEKKQQHIQTAVTEFKWLLHAQQQKKSSK